MGYTNRRVLYFTHFTTKTDRITQTTPYDSSGILVFWCQRPWRNSNGVTPKMAPNRGGVR